MKNARPPEGKPSAPNSADFNTCNPRHLRALALLLQRPARREELDSRAGCSNSPELIAELRRRGLNVPCERIQALDRDGRPCRPGIYHLTDTDKAKLRRWMRSRNTGHITPELAAWLAVIAGPAAVCAIAVVRFFGWA